MKIAVELTWSKLTAWLVLGSALYLDIVNHSATLFQYALPFIVFLITGKQLIDWRKNGEVKEDKP